jgi:CubicO group peptidase (beta-lactamase class C family)
MHRASLPFRTSALLLFILAHPLPAQRAPRGRTTEEARTDSVFGAFDRSDAPGCSVGVFRDGAVRYARGYGMANLELGIANSPHTVFDVGSVSKQFTAMSILLLQQDGKLNIDESVRKYVPELPAYADQITLRQLLSHTSGIRDHFGLLEVAGRDFDGTADTVDYLRLITRSAAPNFEPGTRYLYSNSGFVLLAQIVYRVSGMPLSRFAAERIFGPLGMRDTYFQDDHTQIIPNRATAYMPRGDHWAIRMSEFDDMAGAGGLHTTVEDFQKWLRNYDSLSVGSREIVGAMTTPTKLKNDSLAGTPPESWYGLGIGTGTWRGLPVNAHTGVWGGYRAAFLRFPNNNLSVATFCNFTTAGPDTLAKRVAAVWLGNALSPDVATAWQDSVRRAPRVSAPAASLAPLAGAWRNELLGELRRTDVSGDTLYMLTGRRMPLVPLGGSRFRATPATLISFEGDSAGAPNRLVVRSATSATTFTRVPLASSAARLTDYVGRYYTPEVDVAWQVRPDSGGLVVTRDGRRVGKLELVSRDLFLQGGSTMQFIRDRSGRITGFVLEAGRVRHLRFDRQPSR